MRRLPLYERLRVRAPCDEEWDAMEERDDGRHCARCDHLVYDVALLTRSEAEALARAKARGERICLNIHVRRSDEAILLADGHVEREPSRRLPPSHVFAVAVAAATAMTGCSTKDVASREAPVAIAPAPIAPPAVEIAPPAPEVAPPKMPEPTPPTNASRAATVAANAPAKKHYRMLRGI